MLLKMISQHMTDIQLHKLDTGAKWFLIAFLIVLSIGVTIGIVYVGTTTQIDVEGTIEHYAGSESDEFDIPEKYPKSFESMLLTTHTHIISFACIFVLLGVLFNFNSVIRGPWKTIIMVEPLVATLVTFGSLWGIRYCDPSFAYLTIISGTLMYISFYLMTLILLYDLIRKDY